MEVKLLQFNNQDIDLIVYDFDGVMTDNRVIVFDDGKEAVIVNRADGLGIDHIRDRGVPQLILSTETNSVVKARAAKLKLEVINACTDKKSALEKYCVKNGHDLKKVIYIGNDLNDLEVMRIVGGPIAPADAHEKVKNVAKLITNSKGGDGVVKEVSDILCKNDN